jgi:hypothetical protein
MKDASPCAAISASGLQARCQALVAMEREEPDKCPWTAATERSLGREPYCVAVSTHDPRGCAGAPVAERGTCEALATGDVKRCSRGNEEERLACDHELQRDRTLLVPIERDVHDTTLPKATAEVKSDRSPPETSTIDLTEPVAAGVLVTATPAGGTRIDFTREKETLLRLPTRGSERARFAASIVIDPTGVPAVDKFEIDAPKVPAITCPSPRCHVTSSFTKLDPKRSSPVSVAFDAQLETPTGKYTVHAQIDSFVRDVVTRTALYSTR